MRRNPRAIWYENLKEVTLNGDYEVTFHLTKPQPSLLRVLPGIRLRCRQHRKADGLHETGGRSRQRADNADDNAGEPPFGFERQLTGNLRAIESAQARRDIRQQRGCDQVAADQPDDARDQRQRYQFGHEHDIEHAC